MRLKYPAPRPRAAPASRKEVRKEGKNGLALEAGVLEYLEHYNRLKKETIYLTVGVTHSLRRMSAIPIFIVIIFYACSPIAALRRGH